MLRTGPPLHVWAEATTTVMEITRRQDLAAGSTSATEFNSTQPLLPDPIHVQATDGYVFSCNDTTVTECLEKRIFGAPSIWPLSIKPGSTCFLYNFDSHSIAGLWRSVEVGMHLDSSAWGGLFPCQCRVEPELSHPLQIPRRRFAFLAGRWIPNPLPRTHAQHLIRAFRVGREIQSV